VIPDVDEVLRKLLIREIDIKGNEVDIAFEQPKREWSSRLSKPTINLFLFDIRENLRLRGAEQFKSETRSDGQIEVRRNPTRMDLRYLMTAWVKEAEDEHLLLSSALMGLLRNPHFPLDMLPPSLQNQPTPIILDVATFPPEAGPIDKFSEIWGVLDNEMRPGIILTVTVSMDPYKALVFPPVKAVQTGFMQSPNQSKRTPGEEAKAGAAGNVPSHNYMAVSGRIKSDKYDPSTLTIVLVEKNITLPINEEGKYAINKVLEGEYHLDILYNKKVIKRQKIQVPGPDYDILV
jgi:hypothetical protein